jgi:hypothetical protein
VGFLALSGQLPFEGTAPQGILVAHATRQPPPLRSVAPQVPAALASVIDRCLRKAPSERYATGEELAEALGKAIGDVENDERAASASAVLSSDEAMVVWRRAAELQAEAAARLESRMRAATETRQILAAGTTPAGGVASPDGNSASDSTPIPTDAYLLRDVEAAAAEVGISQRYVALALAELHASPDAIQRAQPMPAWKERMATRLFGTTQRSVSVSRVFRSPPRVVLQALGRSLQAVPWSLTLRDTLGGHPLDGGVLVFELPGMGDGMNYKWTWTRYGVYAKEVRVTLANVPSDPRACEVSMHIDLRNGITANVAGYGALTGAGSAVGTVGGAIVGTNALALAGAAVIAPALAAGLLLGVGVLALVGPLYRWEVGKTTQELSNALAAVDTAIRSLDIFGEAPPPGLPRKSSGAEGGYIGGFQG